MRRTRDSGTDGLENQDPRSTQGWNPRLEPKAGTQGWDPKWTQDGPQSRIGESMGIIKFFIRTKIVIRTNGPDPELGIELNSNLFFEAYPYLCFGLFT